MTTNGGTDPSRWPRVLETEGLLALWLIGLEGRRQV